MPNRGSLDRGRRRERFFWRACERESDASEAAMASSIFLHGGQEIFLGEFGPRFWRDDDFGVAELPEEKVGEAHFAGGADEKIGVGGAGGVEAGGEGGFVDGVRIEGAGPGVAGEGAGGVGDFGARAVAEGEGEGEGGVAGGFFDGVVEAAAGVFRQVVEMTDGAKADVALHDFGGAFGEEPVEQGHKTADFLGRALPVFFAEGVKREERDAGFEATGGAGADGFRAAAMAFDAG